MNPAHEKVLLIGHGWEIEDIVTAEDAFKKLASNTAVAFDTRDGNMNQMCLLDWIEYRDELKRGEYYTLISTPHMDIPIPHVIRATNKSNKKRVQQLRASRENIFIRDNGLCQYCHAPLTMKNFTVDHVVPSSRGGNNSWTNKVCCCATCNAKKGSQTLEETGMKLKSTPTRPTRGELVMMRHNMKDGWKLFCGNNI